MEKFLPKDRLPLFLRELQTNYTVFAPQQAGEHIQFTKLIFPENIRLDYGLSLLPPTRIILPFKQEVEIKDDGKKSILFGVHLADLEALVLLDEIFDQPQSDSVYKRKREKFIIVGIDYPQQTDAFFKKERNRLKKRCDLYLDDIGSYYLAIPGSRDGKDIIRSPHFETKGDKEYARKDEITESSLLKNPARLKEAVLNSEHPLWEEMGQKCLGCGICTYVCPLCYCFDRKEENRLDQPPQSLRCWSSCLLADFHTVAGNHCFEKTIKERFYFWYYHKFVRMTEEYGHPGCVGCGRCSAYCPAGINIQQNLIRLLDSS